MTNETATIQNPEQDFKIKLEHLDALIKKQKDELVKFVDTHKNFMDKDYKSWANDIKKRLNDAHVGIIDGIKKRHNKESHDKIMVKLDLIIAFIEGGASPESDHIKSLTKTDYYNHHNEAEIIGAVMGLFISIITVPLAILLVLSVTSLGLPIVSLAFISVVPILIISILFLVSQVVLYDNLLACLSESQLEERNKLANSLSALSKLSQKKIIAHTVSKESTDNKESANMGDNVSVAPSLTYTFTLFPVVNQERIEKSPIHLTL